MNKKYLTCINCPIGCSLTVTEENGKLNITGNSCKRGREYAKSEMTNPVRTVTTSLFVNNGVHPTVCVKTSSEIPKKLIFQCMKELTHVKVNAPVKIGDVIVKNILNTGANIVATRNINRL